MERTSTVTSGEVNALYPATQKYDSRKVRLAESHTQRVSRIPYFDIILACLNLEDLNKASWCYSLTYFSQHDGYCVPTELSMQ